MRAAGQLRGLVAALKEPLREFARQSRARVVLIVTGSGQVLAQHGFTAGLEVVSIASLAAAAHASSRALGDVVGAGPWTHLHHQGRRQELFLAPFRTPAEEFILVAIFDEDSSLGLVRLFCDRLAGRVAALPELQRAADPESAERFEKDLEAGLKNVFGPDRRDAG